MATPTQLTETMLEGTSGIYSFALVDEQDVAIAAGFLTTLTLTLYDVYSHQIVNGRESQNILNANNGSISTSPGPPLVTTVTLEIQPADTVIVQECRQLEQRALLFTWTWDLGRRTGKHAVQFGVENLAFTP